MMKKKHDIFLSHSGEQKGFARDLNSRLCSRGYSVFFDQNDDSLPPGEAFPPLIFSAAETCDLALVVISDDFFCSQWPMMEPCAFADRLSQLRSDPKAPHFTILPLFFKLSPSDIKDDQNVEKWRNEWEIFELNKQGRISAAKCEETVTKVLPTLNGVIRAQESHQGESSYIDDVVDRVSSILRQESSTERLHQVFLALDKLWSYFTMAQSIFGWFSSVTDSKFREQAMSIIRLIATIGSGLSRWRGDSGQRDSQQEQNRTLRQLPQISSLSDPRLHSAIASFSTSVNILGSALRRESGSEQPQNRSLRRLPHISDPDPRLVHSVLAFLSTAPNVALRG